MIGDALTTAGSVVGIIGVFWFMWDKYATAPGWWIGIGLGCLLAGVVLS